jgi:hypothetical protein
MYSNAMETIKLQYELYSYMDQKKQISIHAFCNVSVIVDG